MKWFLEFIPGKIEFICGNRSRITADLEGYFKRSRRSCHQHCKRQQISVEFKRLMTIRLVKFMLFYGRNRFRHRCDLLLSLSGKRGLFAT